MGYDLLSTIQSPFSVNQTATNIPQPLPVAILNLNFFIISVLFNFCEYRKAVSAPLFDNPLAGAVSPVTTLFDWLIDSVRRLVTFSLDLIKAMKKYCRYDAS